MLCCADRVAVGFWSTQPVIFHIDTVASMNAHDVLLRSCKDAVRLNVCVRPARVCCCPGWLVLLQVCAAGDRHQPRAAGANWP